MDTQEGGLQKTQQEHKQLHTFKHENDTYDTYDLQTAPYAKEPQVPKDTRGERGVGKKQAKKTH